MGDYNKCVEENLKLKENNFKLAMQKQTVQQKLDILSKKLEHYMMISPNLADPRLQIAIEMSKTKNATFIGPKGDARNSMRSIVTNGTNKEEPQSNGIQQIEAVCSKIFQVLNSKNPANPF